MTNRTQYTIFTKFDDPALISCNNAIVLIEGGYYHFKYRQTSIGPHMSIEPVGGNRTKCSIEARPYFGSFIDDTEQFITKYIQWKMDTNAQARI